VHYLRALFIWIAILTLSGSDFAVTAPLESKGPQNKNYWAAEGQDQAQKLPATPQRSPSLLHLFTSGGLKDVSEYCANQRNDEPDKWLHDKFICEIHVTDVLVAAFTGLLVLVTAGLILVGFIQSGKMRKTIRTMENSEIRELRAYVFIKEMKFSSHLRLIPLSQVGQNVV
jgi:hypothetical protein